MNTNFIRITTEDKLILQGLVYKPEKETQKAYLHIHGMGGNFYENRFLDSMARELTESGFAFLVVNTRGHDIVADFPIAGTEEKFKRIGDALEKFEESVFDIKSAIDYLEKQGYTEIILCGHSLGAVKVVYYLTQTKDSRVHKLVLMSPPDMVGLAEKESYYKDLMTQSKQLVESGKGEELLPIKVWDWYYLSAQTYISLYSRDFPVDIFNTYDKFKESALKDITIPVLAFFGEKDDAAIMPIQEALDIIKSKAVNAPRFDTKIIPRASHSYFREEDEMAKVIIDWLVN